MARVPIPDPGSLLEAVAGRVDAVEATLEVLGRDVTALGHALGGINASLRDLAAPPADRPASAGSGAEADSGGEEAPRDWIEVTDATSAVDWLIELHTWVETRFQTLTAAYEDLPACWPWHPKAVVELEACRAARAAAYAAGPWPVIEFEHRHLPDTLAVVTQVTTSCHRAEGHHAISSWRFHYDLHALSDLATWWTTTWHRTQERTPAWIEHLHASQGDCRNRTAASTQPSAATATGTDGAAPVPGARPARAVAAVQRGPVDEAGVLALVAQKVPDLPPGLTLCLPHLPRRTR